jgi:hypothetical protein
MTNIIITTIIGSLILLAFGLSLKIAQLIHRLNLSEKENDSLREKYSDFEKKHFQYQGTSEFKIMETYREHSEKESQLEESHAQEITKLKQQISDMQKEPDMGGTTGVKLMAHRNDSPFNE